MYRRILLSMLAACVSATTFAPAHAVTIGPGTLNTADTAGGGTSTIVSLSGLGGNLETNMPSLGADGVLKLTTTAVNSDRAEALVTGPLGSAVTALADIDLSYYYYKSSIGDGNAFAAPALKIALYSATGSGDNYGQLIFEPSWNQGTGGSTAVPADDWQNVVIDENTGSGADASEGWWWSGGFNVASGAGGPPIRSLAEWLTAFQNADPDFADAVIVDVRLGVGTYNQSQTGYADAVSIAIPGGFNDTVNYAIPEPASMTLLCLGGLMLLKRRRH